MKIAILGASEPHLPLYLKAKSMGLETYCIAWKSGAYCKEYADHFFDISITEKEKIAQLCKDEKIDGIISNAIEEAVPTMAYVSEQCGFNGISYKAALRATNKLAMRQCIEQTQACKQPKFNLINSSDFTCDYYPVIVKPVDGSCSKGVTKVLSADELKGAIEHALLYSKSKEVLVEEFIDGKEVSVETISFKDEHYVLMVTDKDTTGAPHFVETGHHQPSMLPKSILSTIRECAVNILRSLEISNGAAHLEFKITSAGDVYFIEAGARGGGDFISYKLVELSTGYDYIAGMLEVALGKFSEPVISNKSFAGVYFFSKETEKIVEYFTNNSKKTWIVDSFLDTTKPLVYLEKSQDRSGYVIYSSTKKIDLYDEK